MNASSEDTALLREFVTTGDERAFSALVRLRFNLVYNVALRHTQGEPMLAEDAAQQVFIMLAKKARKLCHHPALAAFLHVAARNAAVSLVRSEHRRAEREQLSVESLDFSSPGENGTWTPEMRAVVDDLLCNLDDTSRNAVSLRFFDGLPFADIGRRLSLSENSARMRVDRALETLRISLSRRKIASSSAAIAACLSGQISSAVPAAAWIAASALAIASLPTRATTAVVAGKMVAAAVVSFAILAAATVMARRQVEGHFSPLASGRESTLENANIGRPTGLTLDDIVSQREPLAIGKYAARVATFQKADFPREFAALLEARRPAGDFGFDQPYSLGEFREGDPLIRILLRAWANLAPHDALESIETESAWKPWFVRSRYTNIVLARWAQTDPEDAWQWALDSLPTIPSDLAQISLQNSAFQNAARKGRLESVLIALADDAQFERAAQFIDGSSDQWTFVIARDVYMRWARQNPDAAVEWAQRSSARSTRFLFMGIGAGVVGQEKRIRDDIAARLNPAQWNGFVTGYANSLATDGDTTAAAQWLVSSFASMPDQVPDPSIMSALSSAQYGAIRELIARSQGHGRIISAQSYALGAASIGSHDDAISAIVEFVPERDQVQPLIAIFRLLSATDPSVGEKLLNDHRIAENVRSNLARTVKK